MGITVKTIKKYVSILCLIVACLFLMVAAASLAIAILLGMWFMILWILKFLILAPLALWNGVLLL